MQGRFANRPCRHAACGTGDFALKVAVGHHRDELVDGVLAGRERSAAVTTRGDAPLDGLAGVPVLAVGDVPEVAGVGGVEAFLLDGLTGEEPLAHHGGVAGSDGRETVGHHVVGVEAYQEVREELEVVDGAVLYLREVHGPPDPGPLRLQVVAAAGRRADLAELGMYGGTVVALVVVLHQDLPVRRYLVVVAGGDDELLATVVSEQILQIASVFLERGCVAADVGEEPPLPLHDTLVANLFGAARAADADPAQVKEVLLLPPEHGSGGVRLGWEGAAAAEGVYRRCKKLAGYRRHVVLPPCRSRG